MTTFVALSRMYRGMHHPLDVAGGVLVGIGAVLVVLFACRAAGAAADARRRRAGAGMTTVAVIAHAGKTLGGGLPELRRVLDAEGVGDPLWCEVPKSKKAPREVERAARARAPT